MRENRRRLDLVLNHQIVSVVSLPSLSISPPNAPAQPQEVPRGDRGIVAEEIDDQVAAGRLDEDRHFSSLSFSLSLFDDNVEKAKSEVKPDGLNFFFPSSTANSLHFRSLLSPLSFSGFSAPELLERIRGTRGNPLVF